MGFHGLWSSFALSGNAPRATACQPVRLPPAEASGIAKLSLDETNATIASAESENDLGPNSRD